MTMHIPKWARVIAAFSGAVLALACLLLGLSNAGTQAAPRLEGTGTDPRIETTTVQADIPISDTRPGDGVAKTVYFANASAGTLTLAFQISGTPILTLTAGAAFGDVEQVVSSPTSPWNVNVGYSVETGSGDYASVRYTVTNTNGAQVEIPISFVRDVDAPTASFSSPGAYSWISGTTSISGLASDGTGAGVQRVEVMTQTSATWVPATGRDSWSYSWTPDAGENGIVHTLYARACDYLNQVQSPPATRVITVDNVMTGIVSNLHSTTHTPNVWSNQATIGVAWTAASDGAGSGLAGYSVLWDTSASTVPDTVQDLVGSATSTSASVVDGSQHYFHIRAVDAAGNWGPAVHLGPFLVDTLAPSITLNAPNGGEMLRGTATFAITWTASDANLGSQPIALYYSTNGGSSYPNVILSATENDGSYTWTLPATDSSAVRVRAVVTDLAGNAAHDDSNGNLTIDSTAPSVTLIAPNGGEVIRGGGTYNIAWSASDANLGAQPIALYYSTNGGSSYPYTIIATTENDGSYAWSVPAIDSATVRVRAIATDLVGHTGQDDSNASFTIDSTPPTVPTLLSPANGSFTNTATITFRWSDESASGATSYTLNVGASYYTVTATSQAVVLPADGTYSWTVRSIDAVGNASAYATARTVRLDTVAPGVTIASPASGAVFTTTHLPNLGISGTATDVGGSGISLVEVTTGTTWAAAQGTSAWTYSWALPTVDQQVFTLVARATDNATNLGTSAPVAVTVDTLALTMSAPVPDQSPWSTSTITYRWTAPADNAGIAGYSLQITSTAGYNATFATTGLAHVFTQATTEGASYYARVRATDGNGNVGAWSPSSVAVTPDLTPPQTSSPSIVESSTYLHSVGTRLYYINTMSVPQLFALQGTSSDALSGVSRVSFTSAFGETPGDVTSGFSPWQSGTPYYGVDPGTTAAGVITATVYDRAGNSSTQTYSYEWDSTAPASTASGPAYATSSPIAINWVATDTQSGVQYTTLWYMKEVTGSWQVYQTIYAGSGTFNFVPPLGDGLYLFATVSADNLGNLEAGPTVSETQTVYDTNVPQSQVTWAPAYKNSSPITMTWAATPTQPQVPIAEVRLWYRMNAGSWTQTSISSTGPITSGTFSFTPPGQGTFDFATVARDSLGKSEATPSGSGDATTVYDSVAPTVVISSPTPGSILTSTLISFSITGTAVDATSGITQVWVTTGAEWAPASGASPWTYSWMLPVVDRTMYTLTARSTDNAGNTGTSSSVSVIVDTVAPTAAAPTPNRSPWITSTVVYTWPASSDGAGIAGYRVLITNTSGYSATFATAIPTYTFAQAYTEGASYHACVQAIDLSGNSGPWSPSSVAAVPDLTAPTITSPAIAESSNFLFVSGVSLYYTNTMSTPALFTVQGVASDALSGLDRATFSRAFGETPPVDTTPSAFAGTYTVERGATASGQIVATVYDQAGNTRTQTYPYALDGTPPSSTASAPAYATSSPISVTWVATDTQSGVYSTTLWYKKETTGTWQSYETATGNSGVIGFVPPLGDGLYLFATAAADNLANVEPRPTVSETQTIYDTKVPQSQVTWAPTYQNSSPITMTWVATPFLASLVEVRLWYRLNAGTWTQTSIYSSGPATWGVFAFAPPSDGLFEFATVARDVFGKSEANPFGFGDASTIYDTQIAPPQGLASSPGGWTSVNNYAVTWSNLADLSGIVGAYYKLDSPPTAWNDGIWVPGAGRTQITGISVIGEGAHPVYVWLRDAAGNINHANRQEAALRYDASAPTGVVVVAPYKTTETQFTVSWSASDAVSGIAYYRVEYMSTQDVNWQAWLPMTPELSALFVAPVTGTDYTFRVTAYDYAGNQAQGTARTRLVPYLKYLPTVTLKWLWWYQYDLYEPNDTPDQAYGPIVSGRVYRGYIWDAKDVSDFYWFTPSASTAVQITLTNIPPGTDYDLYVYDYQGGYRLIASSNQSGSANEALTFTSQAGRKYYVRVYPYSGFSSQQSYQLTVTYQ